MVNPPIGGSYPSGGSFGASGLPTASPVAPATGVTAVLRFAGALLIVGAVTVILEQFAGESTAYAFVILIILGYSAVGHRLTDVTSFFQTTGITTP